MRINGFTQIKGFYSWTFENQDKGIKPQHISLYLFLLNQNNRVNWVEWFKCPFDLAMAGSCISSKKTYYKCLNDLKEWGLIDYEKGVNNWKAPTIKLEVLKDTSTVPQVEQASEPLPLPQQHPIYKLITDNLKLVIDNLPKWIEEEKNKEGKPNFEERKSKWLMWFNLRKKEYTGKEGKFKMLNITDSNNLKKLFKSYNADDFEYAIKSLFQAEWAIENNMLTPSHFLRVENFNKYLNTEHKKEKEVIKHWNQDI